MFWNLSSLVIGGLLLAGCAGMDSKANLFMDTSTVRPPPLPVADMPPPKTIPKPNLKIKREAVPVPIPRPVPVAPPVVQEPPHHWYDHLKFWQK
jgi:hypothetical protein